jgi:hypothetical protein
MSTTFYKTNDAAALAAMAIYDEHVAEVRKAGAEFAAHYGGTLLARADLHGYSIAGLCFHPEKNDPLWTKPDPKSAGMQRPRTSIKSATKEQRAELAELLAGWQARFPIAKADLEPVLTAMGTDWGNLFFCGFAMFQHNGCIYVATGAKLAPVMQEILGSEYNAAKSAHRAIKAAA